MSQQFSKRSVAKQLETIGLISMTSQIVSFEKILKESLTYYLKKFGLIRNTQHGFRRGKSCLTNLLEFLESITNLVPVDIIYLDFQKAFDKVPHKRLVRKLEAHRILGKVQTWISNRSL
jgi:Reverse transcriptase (RNA-dependent DNA polymerase)